MKNYPACKELNLKFNSFSVLVTHISEQLRISLKVGFSELEDYGCIQTGFFISHPEASFSENSVTLCIDKQKKL